MINQNQIGRKEDHAGSNNPDGPEQVRQSVSPCNRAARTEEKGWEKVVKHQQTFESRGHSQRLVQNLKRWIKSEWTEERKKTQN